MSQLKTKPRPRESRRETWEGDTQVDSKKDLFSESEINGPLIVPIGGGKSIRINKDLLALSPSDCGQVLLGSRCEINIGSIKTSELSLLPQCNESNIVVD